MHFAKSNRSARKALRSVLFAVFALALALNLGAIPKPGHANDATGPGKIANAYQLVFGEFWSDGAFAGDCVWHHAQVRACWSVVRDADLVQFRTPLGLIISPDATAPPRAGT